MWYVLCSNQQVGKTWESYSFPEQAHLKICQLLDQGVLSDEIIIINASSPEIIMDVQEFQNYCLD